MFGMGFSLANLQGMKTKASELRILYNDYSTPSEIPLQLRSYHQSFSSLR
jgi:hypothetical protein